MINRLNSIWKNLLIDFLGAIVLAILIVYNLLYKAKDPDFRIIFGVIGFLILHGLFLLFLFIKNLIDKAYLKSFGFILIAIVLFIGIWLSLMVVMVFLIGAQSLDNGVS
jgi:hypothetical protein